MKVVDFNQEAKRMYRVYVLKRRKGGSELIDGTRTNTPSPTAAKAAFLDLRRNTEFEGKNYILLMTKDKEKLNVHLFNSQPGDDAYFDLDQEPKLEAAA